MSDFTNEQKSAAVEVALTTASDLVSRSLGYRTMMGRSTDLGKGQVWAPVVDEVQYVVLVRAATSADVMFQETDDLGEVPAWVSGNWSPPEAGEGSESDQDAG